MPAMIGMLKLDSHPTKTAVNPSEPQVSELMELLMADAYKNPMIPQTIPDNAIVLKMIFLVFIPEYLAVGAESPTTDISYPCLVFFR